MATMADSKGISWSIYWRSVVIALVVSFVISFVGGSIFIIIDPASRTASELFTLLLNWSGIVVGFIAYFLVFNYFLANAIGKTIGGKRLELVEESAFRERQ